MFFTLLAAVVILACFPRLRRILWITLVSLCLFCVPGLAEDPGLVWALIFAITIFTVIVYGTVRLMAANARAQRDLEDRTEAFIVQSLKTATQRKTFGAFKPRP